MSDRFWQHRGGGVAVIFALALVPALGIVGAAVDYTRLASARQHIQQAVDAAALDAAKATLTLAGESEATRDKRTRGIYDANLALYKDVTTDSFAIVRASDKLQLGASGTVPLVFGAFLGMNVATVNARATVPLGTNDLEVALVLDNTGSMRDYGKIDNLRTAAKNFITTIESARTQGSIGKASFAVVPFATQVRVDAGLRTSPWLSFATTTGSSNSDYTQVTATAWTGCIADRAQPYNSQYSAPAGTAETQYPAARCADNNLKGIIPLSTDYGALRTAISAMTPSGNTNTTIGLAWGLNVLTRGMPLGDAAVPPGDRRTSKVIVFLTDGENTQDRFDRSQSNIDTRMSTLCTAAKHTDISIYTIRVMQGNETLLRGCASLPDNSFSITAASDLDPLFQRIARSLLRLRLSS
jgi:Flp pilus assembly protein TadG